MKNFPKSTTVTIEESMALPSLTVNMNRFRWRGSMVLNTGSKSLSIKITDGWDFADFEMAKVIEAEYGINLTSASMVCIFFDLYKKMILQNPLILKRCYIKDFMPHLDEANDLWKDIYEKEVESFLKKFKTSLITTQTTTHTVSKMSEQLPGVHQKADCPCGCGGCEDVWVLVQHLNDDEAWTRNQIADWLDYLQDNHGYDFTFGSDKNKQGIFMGAGKVSVLSTEGWKEVGYIKESGA